MASLGALLLLLAFVTAAYAVAAAVVGARRRNTRLIESAIGAFYTIAAIMTVASGVIIYAFVAGDYSIATCGAIPTVSSRCSTRSPRTGVVSTAR